MDAVALAIPLGLIIGLVVGAVGGGGAILALPVLVYILGEEVGPASTASLIVVAIAAGIGAGALALRGHVCWRVALTFVAPAAAGSLLGTLANTAVSPEAADPQLRAGHARRGDRDVAARGRASEQRDRRAAPRSPPGRIVVRRRLGVGALTGFFGVGGGFLIVPVLTLWLGFSFRRAVATSLVIITLTGTAPRSTSHLAIGAPIDVWVTVALASSTGSRRAARLALRPARAAGRARPRVRRRRRAARAVPARRHAAARRPAAGVTRGLEAALRLVNGIDEEEAGRAARAGSHLPRRLKCRLSWHDVRLGVAWARSLPRGGRTRSLRDAVAQAREPTIANARSPTTPQPRPTSSRNRVWRRRASVRRTAIASAARSPTTTQTSCARVTAV